MREEKHFEVLAPIGCNVSEKFKKKIRKCDFFSKVSISTLVQPQNNLELKFERNTFNRFCDNCDTDCEWRRRTPDILKPHTMSSADRVKQS